MFEAIDSLAGYWERRAQKFARHDDGLAAVCSFGMPRFYNRSIELCQQRALRAWFGRISDADVLEIGCGVGRWTAQLAGNGNRVYGIDLSPTMVGEAQRRLRQRGLSAEFQVADVACFDAHREFDAALSVTVLQHIIDDAEFSGAISNVARQLKSRGRFIMLEAAPSDDNARCNSPVFRARPLSSYVDALEHAGFSIDTVSGVDPCPLKTWMLPFWNSMPRSLALSAVAMATAVSLPLDLLLARHFPRSSWHKVIVASRKD